VLLFNYGFSIHSLLVSPNGSGTDIRALHGPLFSQFGFETYVCQNKVLTVHLDRATLWDFSFGERQLLETLLMAIPDGYACRLEPLVENPSASISNPRIRKRFELPQPLSTPSLLPHPTTV
jgi:hypothetical protein